MVNPELLKYVRDQLAQGVPKESIRLGLISSGGWNESDINEAFTVSDPTPTTAAPQPIPQAQPMRTFQVQEVRHKNHFFIKLILRIVLLIVLLAGSAYIALAFILNPETAVSNAVGKMKTTERLHSDIRVDLVSEKDTANTASLSVVTDADRGFGDVKLQTLISLSYPMFSGKVELRVVDDMIFIKALSLPPAFSAYSQLIGDGWYSISFDSIKKAATDYASSAEISTTGFSNLDNAYKLLMDSGIISEMKFSGISKIDSGFVRTYTLEINKNAFLNSVDEVGDVVGTENPYAAMGKSLLSALSIEPITVSTSLITGSLREVKFSVGSETVAMRVNVVMGYDDTIDEIIVEKPESATSLDTYLSDYLDKPKTNSTQSTSDTDLWVVYDKMTDAVKNVDVDAYNKVVYEPIPAEEVSMFKQSASMFYPMLQIKKEDYVNKWQDAKQAIYSTELKELNNSTTYGYSLSSVSFINDKGAWKVLSESSMNSMSTPKNAVGKTGAQIQAELREAMADTDEDGVTDQKELCAGSQASNKNCKKTDPKKRDTNGDGIWDGIEAYINR
ncbi:MAG: hypothetical protein QG640_248 [Patescibacteria group bacterium]|nr:hypothetical protein [Patescibacteria group bacterium]